ncbi:IS4 family transposase [Schinkia azotoformans]|uniref:IS4 family transposase n=1 Tax=Schinkia azotoformans TaxID=1454 RepID=UPI002E24C7D3|nr:IS4 family transposase [Schinkia azotoformans]MED4351033.1 IS4 family transposase [Schinkia azotoformans]
MSNTILNQKTVLRQCLELVPSKDLACPLLNYGNKKLTIEALVKIFIVAQLDNWKSYPEFDIKMRAYKDLMEDIDLESISSSQLSRRINELDTAILQNLFFKLVDELKYYTNSLTGFPPNIGRLRIVDATHISLPAVLSDWAYVTKGWNVVKMHTRLVVASPDVSFPDKIVPSNGKVTDHEGGDLLIEISDATYVMDRGYMDLYRMNEWIKDNIKFVIRLRKDVTVRLIEEYEVPEGTTIQTDAKVILGESGKMRPLRLVEFLDEEGNEYRVVTTRWDLKATEVAEIYKNQWIIELFFKWIKQSLRFVKVWSTKPQGIWNQMFIAMIAYILTLIVKLKTNSKKKPLSILTHIRTYLNRSWEEFIAALAYKPKKTSKGRQKIREKPKIEINYGNVALVNLEKKKRERRKIK